jgi:hypothetical protein
VCCNVLSLLEKIGTYSPLVIFASKEDKKKLVLFTTALLIGSIAYLGNIFLFFYGRKGIVSD